MNEQANTETATLYRMVMSDHLCPYGLKSKDFLERQGYEVEDNHLTTREETDAFMERHGVETTPQIWIGEERVGGYDELREHFGKEAQDPDKTSYQPVIAIFVVAFLMALGLSWAMFGEAFAGILMLAGVLTWLSAPVALFIGTVGAVSVFKAVYVDKRELKCACVGGNSNVPLGFISLTENLMMMLMGIWMPIKAFALGW